MSITLNKMFNRSVVYMCMGGSPSAPPPPPPPAPEAAAPVMFGAKENDPNLTGKSTQRLGKKKLQIPLTQAGGSTGLGIPSP